MNRPEIVIKLPAELVELARRAGVALEGGVSDAIAGAAVSGFSVGFLVGCVFAILFFLRGRR